MKLKCVGVLLLAFTLLVEKASPTTQQNTTASPTTPLNTTASPTTQQNTTASPTTPQNTTASSTAPQNTTASPTTPQNTTASPTTPQNTTASPTTPQNTTASPTTPQNTTASPTTPQNTTASQTTPQNTTASPTTPQSTTASPPTPQSTKASPTTPQSTTASPTTPQSNSAGPTKTQSTTAGAIKTQSTSAGKEYSNTGSNTIPNIETARFKLKFTVKVNASFDAALGNPSSDSYKNYSKEFREKMTTVYIEIPWFVYIEVTGFFKGSIGVLHNVIIKAGVNATDVQTALKGPVRNAMKHVTIFNNNACMELNDTDIDKIGKTVEDKCNAEEMCPKNFMCTGGNTSQPICRSPCTPGYCQHGVCYVDTDGHPMCSCEITEHVVYGGTKCDKEVERLDMKKGTIAGIAGGVGGGVILLLFIALGCMCYSRRKGKNPDKYMKHQEEDDIHLAEQFERDVFSNSRAGGFNYGADIKDEYRYSGRNDGREGYEEWLAQKNKSEQESNSRRSRVDDFRASRYADNRSRNHGDVSRGDFDQMEPASMFGRDISGRQSGLGTSHYRFPEDMSPDYDLEDKRQMRPNSRDQNSERPYTRMPTGQTSRPQSSLLSSDYSQGRPVYECIDTDEAYSIQRPDFR
ncbi:mucin-17-like isoform X2 [Haliotis cracherodii]|uniref:mucin-17-like isoform X2 n=1 Tax=Haliotis cracherodii TaxID=6455 RepID=UPI0039E74CB4